MQGLRPTPDRVRETLFNWLGQDLSGWRCLDAFAGTGVLGFEAASRGAAQVLMVVVPKDAAVTAEVVIDNKDIGFVRAGQAVEVKLETFPFTRYGTVPAEVKRMAADAVADDKRGAIPAHLPPILERLQIDPSYWLHMTQHFESRFKGLVGAAYKLKAACATLGYRRTPNLAACRELLT